MPYIKTDDRTKFDVILKDLPHPLTKGELEYCIFYMMKKYMKTREYTYSNLHDTVYAAHHCGDEYCRRYLNDRENTAITNNGDVIVDNV
jgi:hypothetical protein